MSGSGATCSAPKYLSSFSTTQSSFGVRFLSVVCWYEMNQPASSVEENIASEPLTELLNGTAQCKITSHKFTIICLSNEEALKENSIIVVKSNSQVVT
jgi:hypothetical protein